ncbi:hypothetical protein [Sphingobium chungangianum]
MENHALNAAFEAEYAKFKATMASSPLYRSLQTISEQTTAVFNAVNDGIEELCGLYLNNDQRNAVTCELTDMILDTALRHGREDSDLTFDVEGAAND